MECGSCGHHNGANAKFCGECGAPLAATCGSCKAEQPPASKFCNQCGSPMASLAADERSDRPAPVAVAVRKNVTALFADLVGSTSFGERVDPEAARAALAPYFEILRSTIEDHAGAVIKFTGDGVLAIFGIPEVSEDDALRAVAAGQALQRRFTSFAADVREQHGIELGLRVGINSGELVVGADDADMVGDVLNTAARLEAACQPGRVMVGEDTWRLTRSAVSYEVLGEVRVKGKTDALATFQVVDDERGAPEDTTPFVGRRDELHALRSAFDETMSTAACNLVTVIGAPGVGKTRLAAELRADIDARSFDLRFERRGSTTFTPIVELLRELTGSGSADDVALLVADHAEATRLTGVLASFLGHGEARSTEESFWAVRRLLEHLATNEALAIVVDDIQWAEPLFWDLLDHLVEWTEAPVLLVALARPELRDLRPELTQIGKRVSASVSLEGLDADTTRELAERLLDTDELPADLIERIPDSTEGNPLFVRELVQMLVDDGVLARDGDRWRLTIDADAIEVPPTVLSLLASRVERLPDDERQVIELASVIGTEFDRGLLGSIASSDVGGRLGALIDRLRRKDLIEPSGAWAGDHPVYRFHHVLVRDAAYRRLLKGHRADLHESVGRYLDGQGPDGDETNVIVAFHYEQVHRYRTELGTLDDATISLAAQAGKRLRHAAEQALAREDLSSAGGYAERGLALTDDEGERSELLLVGCEALLSSGAVGRGAALVDQMSDFDGDARLSAWADCFRAQLWSLTDSERLSEAAELSDGAAARLDDLGDQAGVAKARLVRAATLARLGRIGECEAELDLALGAARTAGDRRRTVAVLGAAPLAALWGPSPVARAGGRCLDVLRLLRITTSSPAVEATSVRCQGLLEALRGRFESAHEKFEASRTTARDLGLRQGLYETELFEGFVELLANDPVAAEPHLRLAYDGLGALGIGADAGQAAALLARSLLRQGRVDEADELATNALAAAGENLQTAVASRAVLGEIRAQQGRADEAESLVAEAIEIAERTDIILDHAIALRSAARIAALRDNEDKAEQHRAASEALLADKGVTGLSPIGASVGGTPRNDRDADETEAAVVDATRAGAVEQTAAAALTNAAAAAMDAIVQARSQEDFVAGRERFHQDFVSRSRSRVFGTLDDMDLAGFTDLAASVFEVGGMFQSEIVALRGDDLAMGRLQIVFGDDVSDRLTVARLDEGLVRELVFFDSDQLRDAYDELDRQWIEFAGGDADWLATTRSLTEALESGDSVAIRSQLADGFVSIDHRPLGLGSRTIDDFVETFQSESTGSSVIASYELVEPIDIDDGVSLARARFTYPDDSTGEMLSINQYHDGRLVRQEAFPADRPDDARRRYRELTNQAPSPEGRVVSNDASRAFEAAWAAAVNDGDLDRFIALLDPGYVHELHQRLQGSETIGADDAIELTRSRIAGRASATTEMLAVRGDKVALGRWLAMFETDVVELLVITVVDDGGLITSSETFEPEDLHKALDRLDAIHVERHGASPLIDMRRGMRRAYLAGDREAIRSRHSPGFVVHDHRPLGLGALDREQYIHSSVPGGMTTLMCELLADNGSVALTHDRIVAPDGSRWEHLVVIRYGDGIFLSADLFAVDDMATARSRFDELVLAETTAATDSFTNTAWLLAQDWARAFRDGDRQQFDELMTTEFVAIARYRLNVGQELGPEDFAGNMFAQRALGETVRVDLELVACRADDLCLVRFVQFIDEYEQPFLLVIQTTGGRIAQLTMYDDMDLLGALDELDDQWVAMGGPAAYVDFSKRDRRAIADRDRVAYRACLSDDFVWTDYRRLGLGVMSADEFVESLEGWFEQTSHQVLPPVVAAVAAWSDSTVLHRIRPSAHDGSTWDFWAVVGIVDGQRRSTDTFELDQADAAQRRYWELTESATLPPFANEATRLLEDFIRLINDTGVESARHLVAPDFVSRLSHVSLIGVLGDLDADGHLELIGDAVSGDASATLDQLIAIRGNHLCLHRLSLHRGDDVSERLCVSRVEGGLAKEVVWFDGDDASEALHELDRQWVATGGPATYMAVRRRFGDAVRTGDAAAVRAVLANEFTATDHRRLGLGTRSADEFIESGRQVAGFSSGGTAIAVQPIAWTDRVLLQRQTLATEEDLGDVSWDILCLVAVDGDRITNWDNFDLDQLDTARSRFDELVGTASERPGIANTASRVMKRSFEVLLDGGLDGHLEWVHPDFHFVARRSNAIGQEDGMTEWREALLFWLDTGIAQVGVRTHAIRLDSLAVGDLLMTNAAGDEMEFRAVAESRDDKLVRLTSYDTDADGLLDALDELDRNWVAQGGPATLTEMSSRYRRAIRSGVRDEIRACVSDDFVAIDHRALGLGHRNADEYVESNVQIAGEDFYSFPTVITEHNADGHLWLARWIRGSSSTDASWEFWTISASRDGRLTRVDTFDISDYDLALARYNELVAADAPAGAASEPEFANTAFGILEAGNQAVVDAELVATRGDDLCLARGTILIDDGVQAGFIVAQAAGDRIDQEVLFDDTQLREALQELDRQYGESLGVSDVFLEMTEGLASLDPEQTAPWIHADFCFRDHRGIGWPDLDREVYLTEMLASIPDGMVSIVRHIDTFLDGRGMVEYHSLVDLDGGVDTTNIGVWAVERDQIIAFEVFAPGDLAAARARFAELLSDDARPPPDISP